MGGFWKSPTATGVCTKPASNMHNVPVVHCITYNTKKWERAWNLFSHTHSLMIISYIPYNKITHSPHTTHTPYTQAQNANDSGDQDTARRLGRFSLGWNIGVYIFYVLLTIAWVVAVAVIVSQATRNVISGTGCVRVNGRLFCG